LATIKSKVMRSFGVQRNSAAEEDASEGSEKREKLMHILKDVFRL
jgi:hypothetical protein